MSTATSSTAPQARPAIRPRKGTQFMALLRAMTKGMLRDKMATFFTFLFPLMFLLVFGLLMGDGASSPAKVGVVGQGQMLTHVPKDVIEAKPYNTWEEAVAAVEKGDIAVVAREQGTKMEVRYSATDRVKSSMTLGVLSSVVDKSNVMASGKPATFSLDAQQVESKALKQIQYMTPSILSWGLATSAAFGAGMMLVGYRKKGLLRRLRLAPVSMTSVAAARVVLAIIVAFAQAALFIVVGVLLFGLKLPSTAALAIPVLLCGTLAFLGVGLLIGSVSKSEEGASAMANFIILPMAFLSGSFFPLDDAPGWLKTISEFLPLKHLNNAMLDVMARGQGGSVIVKPCLILLAFAIVTSVIALWLFNKTGEE